MFLLRSITIACAAMVLSVLAACETPPPELTFPELTYAHLGQMRLQVGTVNVHSKYRSPMQAPNVEHLFPVSPERALRQWAADRLMAGGYEGEAHFVIIDARVVETPLTKDTTFTGTFTKQQSERYEATVEAVLELGAERGRANARARASRSMTVREDDSLNDREKKWFRLIEDLMSDFDREMERQIKTHLVNWLM